MRLNRVGLNKLFVTQKDGSEVYKNKSPLYVRALRKYEDNGLFTRGSYVEVLAILDLELDGEHYGLNLSSKIRMMPSHIDYDELDGQDYIKMTFFDGDTFRTSKMVIKDNNITEKYYKLFVFEGARYPWMTVNNAPRIFDNTHLNNFSTPSMHKVLYDLDFSELTYAGTTNQLYRNSDRKLPPTVYGIKELRMTAKQWITKTGGSYIKDTMKNALITEHTQNSDLEDILRM